MRKVKLWAFYALMLIFVCVTQGAEPKFIFLFIGDGMGEPHCTAADQYIKDSKAGKGLVINEFPIKGKISTFAKNSLVTDSAAAGTALSSGHKVNNGAINFDAGSGETFEPMGVFAKTQGYKVGIISSSGLNHATPAAFYASSKGRGDYYEIAVQMAASDIDYLGGPYPLGVSEKKEEINKLAADNGFKVADNARDFMAMKSGAGKVWVYSKMDAVIDGRHSITLADHTRKAIELLKGGEGFFIMVEGAQIDWASHGNDAAGMIFEMLEFDAAIRAAVDFYHKNSDDTLIVVTADHETGGLSLDMEKLASPGMSLIINSQKGSRSAAGEVLKLIEKKKMNFDEALPLMMDFFGVKELSDIEKEDIRTAFNDGGEAKGDFSYGDNKKITLAWVRLVSARAGLIWSSLGHTADMVPVAAMGAQSHRFAGNLDNTTVCWYMREIMTQKNAVMQEQAR